MPQEPNDTTSATFLKGIGDVKGDWIDAIWEPGRTNPNMLTHIVISETPDGVHIKGTSYTAENISGNDPLKAVGHFESEHVALLAGRDGFSYQYEGGEYRATGAAKVHSGVGFYEFRKHPVKTHTFEGSFLVHEEKISRYVQGEKIKVAKSGELDDSARSSVREFLKEKRTASAFEGLEDGLQLHVGAELSELTANLHAKNPYATAFLFRKILEKLLFLVFLKNGMIDKIRQIPGQADSRLKGLNDIIKEAEKTSVRGTAILHNQTAEGIKGSKYLGDMAAHGPTPFSVDMIAIDRSIPFMRGAYSELLTKLPSPKKP